VTGGGVTGGGVTGGGVTGGVSRDRRKAYGDGSIGKSRLPFRATKNALAIVTHDMPIVLAAGSADPADF